MRGKTNEISSESENSDEYGFRPLIKNTEKTKRLDLNDLLKRAKEARKNDKKNSLLIFSGAAVVVGAFLLILNL